MKPVANGRYIPQFSIAKNCMAIPYTVFLGENVIQIAKMQSSVATNLHYLSILIYNKSQKWKILATLGLF